MELPHIFVLVVITLFLILLIPGIIRKGGWDNYLSGLSKYYVEHSNKAYSSYIYMFKAAFGQKGKK